MSSCDETSMPKLSSEDVNAFLISVFPEIEMGRSFVVEEARYGYVRMRMHYRKELLRPGGTISGPAMFTLADLSTYAAILATVGKVELAVTSNLNINFLRKPGQKDMLGEANILKLGRKIIVAEVSLRSEGEEELAAHATVNYTLPTPVF